MAHAVASAVALAVVDVVAAAGETAVGPLGPQGVGDDPLVVAVHNGLLANVLAALEAERSVLC